MNNQERTQQIRQLLTEKFSPTALEIIDNNASHIGHQPSGAGHFTLSITAAAFAGKSLIERHRLINSALDDMMQTEIHALSIKSAIAPNT